MTTSAMIYEIPFARKRKNIIASFISVLLATAVGYMTYREGMPGGGIFLTSVFLLLGLIGLTFRKVSTFDKTKNRFSVRTSILGYNFKEQYEMKDFQALEFHLRDEKTYTSSHQSKTDSDTHRIFAYFKENDQEFRLQLYSDNMATPVREKADEIAKFLDVELKIVDNRKGIEKIFHKEHAKPAGE